MEEAFLICGEHIHYVHLKNWYKIAAPLNNAIRCGLADGIINNRELLKRLARLSYKGPVAIEAPREGDREWFAKQDIAYIRALVAEINAEPLSC
jgi:sugar phosphate isomerase/epimerase